MTALWDSDDPAIWAEHLDALPNRLQALRNEKLSELDRWFWKDLPDLVQSRSPKHITTEELVKIVEWKLTQGRWRPKLLDYARAQPDERVKEASSRAYAALSQSYDVSSEVIEAALHPLTKMKGMGPATGSAVLVAFTPDVPFMSDQALHAVQKKKEYTLRRYKELVSSIKEKALALSSEERVFTCKDVERALWSEAATRMKPKKAEKKPNKKRKRDREAGKDDE